MKYILLCFLGLGFFSFGIAQPNNISFDEINRLPPFIYCAEKNGCSFLQDSAIVIGPGGRISYEFNNLDQLVYRFDSKSTQKPDFSVLVNNSSCLEIDASKSKKVDENFNYELPLLGGSIIHQEIDQSCVQLIVDPSSTDSIILSSIQYSSLPLQQILTMSSERAATRQWTKLKEQEAANLIRKDRREIEELLANLPEQHKRLIDQLSFYYIRAIDTDMATSLADAVGAINSTSNPTNYKDFNTIVESLKANMDSNGVRIKELERTIETFQVEKENPVSWINKGFDLVQGILAPTPFGMAASGLRSILADTFDKENLVLRSGAFSISINNPNDAEYLNKRIRGLPTKVGDFVAFLDANINDDDILGLVELGLAHYQSLDTLLTNLEKTNNTANYFKDINSNITELSIIAKSSSINEMESIFNLLNATCDNFDDLIQPDSPNHRSLNACDQVAFILGPSLDEEAEIHSFIDNYFSELNDVLNDTEGEEMNGVGVEIQQMKIAIDQTRKTSMERYLNLESQYKSYIYQLIKHMDTGNPFTGEISNCDNSKEPVDQIDNFCSWHVATNESLENLKRSYTSRFGETYSDNNS